MSFSHCTDGEFFRGEFATPEDAAADAFNDEPEQESVEIGENVKKHATHYVSGESILDQIAGQAYDECGEIADEWLGSLIRDKEKCAELEKLIGDWLEANEPATFWRVENIRTITRAEMVAAGQLQEEV